ncbi:IS1634 family transposase [Acidilutibacter cellobiosedens]|jgi:transposase|uniref:IS1634 family transposase n=1 Tax=Acidilutibacter cellobiosedens TaxID=2507161 RepID=A0A410QE29_9FIRM|nr:IS1634 family transposase [Acidilutibacter cellobiosedens]QAT62251.1 IS1634 family transposase [Acidilutibacter cellobiosedens]QAT62636.1 IS1634 family transposase [Acidilutibacter cellobiosedens]
MRLSISKSKNATSLYVKKDVVVNGKRTTKIVEKLGTVAELEKKLGGEDPVEWAKKYIAQMNLLEKEGKETDVIAKYSPSRLLKKDVQFSFNGGYLFLQKIYHDLGIHNICSEIKKKHKFNFNLDSILSRLIYGRILFPGSKLSTYELSSELIEPPDFQLQHIYRALEIISKESDFIQSSLYQNSLKVSKRNTGILYYDCTNYFFEIEQSEGLKQYGFGKDHKPNPIVQMGMFMDGNGIPLAFSISKGNTNEQLTLKPLEKKILSDFNVSRFVVCTDAGLASNANRKFNDKNDRAFITTQSIKKLKNYLKDWALDPKGWHLSGDDGVYDIMELDEKNDIEKIFYKERWIKEDGLEQRLVVTYSIKYRNYHRKIRSSQIERAMKLINTNPKAKLKKANQNDYKRFIEKKHYTSDGKQAKKEIYSIDTDLISKEETYDGFYGVCTNLEDDVDIIVKVNRKRWEIEESFRIMKSEFKARPVHLSRDDRIEAHFMTCFMALLIYRILEKKLEEKFTCSTIINSLRKMNFKLEEGEGYIPIYTRTDFTDALHEVFGFRTDYEIVTLKQMKKIFKLTKNR